MIFRCSHSIILNRYTSVSLATMPANRNRNDPMALCGSGFGHVMHLSWAVIETRRYPYTVSAAIRPQKKWQCQSYGVQIDYLWPHSNLLSWSGLARRRNEFRKPLARRTRVKRRMRRKYPHGVWNVSCATREINYYQRPDSDFMPLKSVEICGPI